LRFIAGIFRTLSFWYPHGTRRLALAHAASNEIEFDV
jgi:hypothetical protein